MDDELDDLIEEVERVRRRRLREARHAGMTSTEARLFAESDIDIGELRRLKQKVPAEWLAKILL